MKDISNSPWLDKDLVELKIAENSAKAKANRAAARTKTEVTLKKAFASSKKTTKSALDEASKAAAWFQDKVTSGVHKVMGSEEYKQKALEVNLRLTIALSSLEDSIKRRDEEIEQLRIRIVELEEQLRNGKS